MIRLPTVEQPPKKQEYHREGVSSIVGFTKNVEIWQQAVMQSRQVPLTMGSVQLLVLQN